MASNYVYLTTSGTWTVPAGVTMVKVARMVGGGGGGGSTYTASGGGRYGAGAGEMIENVSVAVTPGEVIPVTIGAGGLPAIVNDPGSDLPLPYSFYQNGGTTSFKHLNAYGGYGGAGDDPRYSSGYACAGGGINGGRFPIPNPHAQAAVHGTRESNTYFGGASGASSLFGLPGQVGGAQNGYIGGAVPAVSGSGGSGAASLFGPGGDGGPDNYPAVNTGGEPPAGSYGAGGGGAGKYDLGYTPAKGGTGAAGAILLIWVEP